MGKSVVFLDLSILPTSCASPSQPSAITFVLRLQSKMFGIVFIGLSVVFISRSGCLGLMFVMCRALESMESLVGLTFYLILDLRYRDFSSANCSVHDTT